MVAVIKYNAGNIQSVLFALERIGAPTTVTDDRELISGADHVIFPGVGEASSAMHYLREHNLNAVICGLRQPVLGICLGMQLMCTWSEENNTQCLGIFEEEVLRFKPVEESYSDEMVLPVASSLLATTVSDNRNVRQEHIGSAVKIPQVGWNNIFDLQSGLFSGVAENSYCYFVHSYYAGPGPNRCGTTYYAGPYSCALHKNNFYGVQFHPEKSAATGEQILKNFLSL